MKCLRFEAVISEETHQVLLSAFRVFSIGIPGFKIHTLWIKTPMLNQFESDIVLLQRSQGWHWKNDKSAIIHIWLNRISAMENLITEKFILYYQETHFLDGRVCLIKVILHNMFSVLLLWFTWTEGFLTVFSEFTRSSFSSLLSFDRWWSLTVSRLKYSTI